MLFGLLISFGCSESESIDANRESEPIHPAEIRFKNGIGHTSGSGPYTGKAVALHSNGLKKEERDYKDGKRHGPAIDYDWYENGQKKKEINYKDKERHGLSTWWHINGQKKSEIHYKDGELHGPAIDWYENGQKHLEDKYRDGQKHGIFIGWYENGQKWFEINWENGEVKDPQNGWDKDGNKIKIEALEMPYATKVKRVQGLRADTFSSVGKQVRSVRLGMSSKRSITDVVKNEVIDESSVPPVVTIAESPSVLKQPRLRKRPQLDTPQTIIDAGVDGRVSIVIDITENGSVSAARIKKSLHPDADSACLKSWLRAKFNPAVQDGSPVAVTNFPRRCRFIAID